ncbi:alpha/beta hydrolase [Actinomadura litoris]|uniref:Alpha/beta fold hydrolase n=1 Tax=Actinomadura litoris TaxID=2678616 RepID=A0A7K1L298_9ACTN|nr:alpha/beta hydrolase [Actinomadura litoris]MUN38529.1 alpha/beta fold hydrolase [Actinomadura litoris]
MSWTRMASLAPLVSLLLLPGPVSTAESPASPAAKGIAWKPCPEDPWAQCGKVPVPVDWARPAGAKIDLAVARRPALDPRKRIGSLFLLPGGPGGSGVGFVLFGADDLDPQILQRFDVIGVDARGIGDSRPLRCPPISDSPSEYPRDAKAYAQLLQWHKKRADECRRLTGPVFDHVDTRSNARDVDAVRAALGERRISLYGESYGTLLGQQYAEEHPGRVRALALDGNMNHSATDVRRYLLTGSTGLERLYRRFAAWCEESPRCALRGQDAFKVLDGLLARADRGELKDPAGTVITSIDLVETIREAMYGPNSRSGWPALSVYLTRLQAQKPVRLTEDFGDTFQPIFCTDFSFPVRDFAHLRSLMAASRHAAPHTRVDNLRWIAVAGCQGYLPRARNPQRPYRIKGVPPVLLVNSRYDVSTPYSDAESVARQIPGSVLLTYDGIGHTSYTRNPCTTAAIDRYLLTLRTPPPDTHCPAEPAPLTETKLEPDTRQPQWLW